MVCNHDNGETLTVNYTIISHKAFVYTECVKQGDTSVDSQLYEGMDCDAIFETCTYTDTYAH